MHTAFSFYTLLHFRFMVRANADDFTEENQIARETRQTNTKFSTKNGWFDALDA